MYLGDRDGQTGQGEGPCTEVRKPGLTGDGCVRGHSISVLPGLIFLPALPLLKHILEIWLVRLITPWFDQMQLNLLTEWQGAPEGRLLRRS